MHALCFVVTRGVAMDTSVADRYTDVIKLLVVLNVLGYLLPDG